jgi:ABC-type sulfate transport system permease component
MESSLKRHSCRDCKSGWSNSCEIATSVAMMFKAEQIVVVGRSPSFSGLRNSLEEAALITGFTPHFLRMVNMPQH